MKKTLIFALLFFTLILSLSCAKEEQYGKVIKEKISFESEDKVLLSANLYPEETKKGVILLHGYQQNKDSWNFIADDLRNEGYNVLALDLRGHGESEIHLESMTSKDYNKMMLDAKAAFNYFLENNINEVSIIGSSLGANVALNYATEEESIQRIVLISPGLDYRGVTTTEAIANYKRPLLIIVGGLDGYSWNSSNMLFERSLSKIKLQPYETNLHGTELIKNLTESKALIINWLNNN